MRNAQDDTTNFIMVKGNVKLNICQNLLATFLNTFAKL